MSRDHYNEQVPLIVADQLEAAATAIGTEFAAWTAEQWERTGIYNWPTAAERSMVWLGRHTIHEGRHHLRDIDAALALGRHHAGAPCARERDRRAVGGACGPRRRRSS